jgi:hypothetical protein
MEKVNEPGHNKCTRRKLRRNQELTKRYPAFSLRRSISDVFGEGSFGQKIDSLDVDSLQSSSEIGFSSDGLGLAPWYGLTELALEGVFGGSCAPTKEEEEGCTSTFFSSRGEMTPMS